MNSGKTRQFDFIIIDLFCLECSFIIAYIFRFGPSNPFTIREWRNISIIIALFDLLAMLLGPFLEGIRRRGYLKELASIFVQGLVWMATTTLYLYALHLGIAYSRIVLILTGFIYWFLTFVFRCAWKKLLTMMMKQNQKHYVLIGENPKLTRFGELMEKDPIFHSSIIKKMPIFDAEELETVLRDQYPDEAVAYFADADTEDLVRTVDLCEKYGVHFSLLPTFSKYISATASMETYENVKLINFRDTPLDHSGSRTIKRMADIVASAFLILLTSPIMLILAVGTKLSSPGPILFKQKRIGLNRREFTMLKFRSMRVSATENTAWSTNEDPRKTKFGSFIRKCSLDELPQLFNVFVGQMSLVGPRPEIPYHVNHFMNEIPLYLVRQRVRPGITGWAQVKGFRGDTDIQKRVECDIWYIENWSLTLDIKIILLTLFGGMINQEKIR